MVRYNFSWYAGVFSFLLLAASCAVPKVVSKTENKNVPSTYQSQADTANSGKIKWNDFFSDPKLTAIIDEALKNNQELNIMFQEMIIAKNEVRARKGEYLPFLQIGAAAGIDKVGRYTSRGANDANTEIKPGEKFPEPLPDLMVGAFASWEVDIWSKLHNAKKSAMLRYLASSEGRNFIITQLVSEIANAYYELMALDNQLEILRQNIDIQKNALEIVRQEKISARVTELAVKKFEAEVLKNQSLQYAIQQQIVETENRINFLAGRYPQTIERSSITFGELTPRLIMAGIPSQLLKNRPDIRQAELQLTATKLDLKVARANFYPSLRIVAGAGYQSFNPSYLIKPESMIYSAAGELMAPLINRNAIKANYLSANARQYQAVYQYERSILNAYTEVINQLNSINNLRQSFEFKSQQVQALTESINIATILFRSARADYMEVLLTQRDALESRFELVETKKQQLNAMVNIYKALGGGWN